VSEESHARGDDGAIGSALRRALELRDRRQRPPVLASVLPEDESSRRGYSRVRAFLATATVVGALGIMLMMWWDRSTSPRLSGAPIDATLARQLSAPDYWRVPSDELLALSAPPLDASLSLETGFEVSLEESVL
jgi:hypothetical protein